MKKLVNHGGIIQYKWMISTKEELWDYIFEVRSKQLSQQIGDWITGIHPNQQFESFCEIFNIAPVMLGDYLLTKTYEGCIKYVDKTLVFNEAGGYCFWDDKTMKLLDWKYLLDCKDIVVLENASIVDRDVRDYLQDKDYLALTNLASFTLEEIFYYCSKAKTIVFQTQAIDKEQINSLLNLASQLEPKEIIVINSDRFPVNDIRLSKHNIKQVYTDEF